MTVRRAAARFIGVWLPAIATFCAQSTGCATPAKMRLAVNPTKGHERANWWVLRDPAAVYPPIVGVEFQQPDQSTEQVVVSRRGVRRFLYQGRKLVRSGPPLAGHVGNSTDELVRVAVQNACRRLADEDTSTLGFYEVVDVSDFATWLKLTLAESQVDPPAHLGYRQIDGELEHFPHGVFELLKAADAF